MLQELVIQDFAIIKKIDVKFTKGLTALTGETGAGKSIILDALGLLLGNRGFSEYVRSGCKKARVQGLFSLEDFNRDFIQDFCQNHGIDFSDQSLIIQRELQENGRNVCRINTQLVPVAALKQLGQYLVDISGQNQSQSLLDSNNHVHLLDQFTSTRIKKPLSAYQQEYRLYHQLQKRLTNLQNNQQQRAQQLDMLQFQVREIKSANLLPEEEEQLLAEQRQLANFEKIHENLQTTYEVLAQNTTGIIDQMGPIVKAMQAIGEYQDEYKQITQELESAYYELQDSQDRLVQQLDLQDYDPNRLNAIEQRLQLLRDLEKKYGRNVAEVIAFGEKAQTQLQNLQQEQQDPQQLQAQLKQQTELLEQKAVQLNQVRHQAAQELTREISQQLKSMYMDKTSFEVRFTKQDYSLQGNEVVEFYLQTNPGETPKPLAKIASGGELARIMLALKTVFAQYQPIGTLVFDEIDTGVSGRVAQAIGEKMAQIAQHVQVLCITHLPQVAAVSDQQYLVKKHIAHQQTSTLIETLTTTQRIEVIAQMLEGTRVTSITRQHAQELLQLAHKS
ncbi:DNA repair protein RecN [Bombilactobacillus bombi]|uniref:DNA repair protein RecN n=1 Tax=Bombilactobacillus bombi TaxID=1303590 RepID=UPI0015E60276|nr:DNA repair protein RecN [Bombilactobacillus bombi]MBA1435109.1 DNA repair protein RecN [Bombilactobacillus bombi]